MAELRYAVAFIDKRTGQCDWELCSRADVKGPSSVEYEGRFFLPRIGTWTKAELQHSVQAELFERRQELGGGLRVPKLGAIALVEVEHD